jgi:hypothetical protein
MRMLVMLWGGMCLAAVIVLSNPRLLPIRQHIMNLAGHEVIAKYPSRLGDPLIRSCFSPKALVALPNDRYLIGCAGGFALFNRATETFSKLEVSDDLPDVSYALYRSGDGIIWQGGVEASRMRLDGRAVLAVPPGNTNGLDNLSYVFSGLGGAVWFGGQSGLFRYDNGVVTGPVLPGPSIQRSYEALPDPRPPTIHGNSRDGRTPIVAPSKAETGLAFVKAMRESASGATDSNGIVWLGAFRALLRLDPRSNEWSIYPRPYVGDRPSICYPDREGRVWVASYFGEVQAFDTAGKSWRSLDIKAHIEFPSVRNPFSASSPPGEPPIPLPPNFMLRGMLEDSQHQIMFATNMGLVIYDGKGDRWSICTPTNSPLPSDIVNCLLQVPPNEIWVATGEGIVILRDSPR